MNITILELGDDIVRISIAGQGHTFMNALKTEILQDTTVDVANYVIEFQFSDPVLTVTTLNKADPVKPVLDACTRLSKNCEELLASLESSAKK